MKYWDSLDREKQVSFYLGLSENIVSLLENSMFYNDVRKALDLCWNWFETKKVLGDELYTLLDDGTEYNGLFIKMQMDEEKANEPIWECIVTAISFVNKVAFESENVAYLLSPLEFIEENLISYFLENYSMIALKHNILVNDFLIYLLKTSINNKDDVMKFFEKS